MTPQTPGERPLRGADVGIPPRQVDFRHSADMPRWVFGDNITATMYLTVLTGFFPPGEDFFVRSVNRYKNLVTDRKLRAEVAGFTAQEVIHSREHDRLNDVLRERGFQLDLVDRAIRAPLSLLYRLPARTQLACTALMEHFTALLAEYTLREAESEGGSLIHEDLRDLWLWHALEELEHKAVSYDVFELTGGKWTGWLHRLVAVPATLATVALAGVAIDVWLVLRAGALGHRGDVVNGVRMTLGRDSVLRQVGLRLHRFVAPNYHPNNHDTTAITARWREILFGEHGRMVGQLRRPAA
ncbi:MAG TPA: metal-dependent hydrolase [Pseudonocardia sp.]|jgi:hypothetical protein